MSIFKKEIEQDITDIVNGKKLLRHEYRRPGQSEYYYLTKNSDDSHDQIDVPDDFGRRWYGKTLPDNRSFKQPFSLNQDDNPLTGSGRIAALKNNQPVRLKVVENSDADGRWPLWHSPSIGEYFEKNMIILFINMLKNIMLTLI